MPQRKKRPLTTGKGTKSKPIPTPGRSPRRVSSKPSEASKVRAAKKTTSSKYRARRQAASKANVTSDVSRDPTRVRAGINQNNKPGAGRVTGTMGRAKPKSSAKVTTGRGRSGPKLPKLPSKSRPTVTGTGRTKPNKAALTKQVAARKAARVAARTAARGASAMGKGLLRAGAKLAGRAVIPLAMAQEVRTMAERQRRYNAEKAARRRKK